MERPDLYVIDESFGFCGVLDKYESLAWDRSLYECGSFQVELQTNRPGADAVAVNRVVYDFNRPHMAGVIKRIEQDDERIIVSGPMLKGIAKQRIVVPPDADGAYGWDRISGAAETVYKHYAAKHLAAPDDSNRALAQVVIAPDRNRGIELPWQNRFDVLADVFKQIGEFTGMGWDIRLDLANKHWVFDVVPGVDRTVGSEEPIIIDRASLAGVQYAIGIENWVNAGYAGGAGEDEKRLIYTVFDGDIRQGLDRQEGFLDCGSLATVDDLIYEGKHQLKDFAREESLDAKHLENSIYRYGEDYDLGDLITILMKDGRASNTRITGIKESYDSNGYSFDMETGTPSKDIKSELYRIGKQVIR